MYPNAVPSKPFKTEQSSVYRLSSPTSTVRNTNIHSLLAATGIASGKWPANHNATRSDVIMQALLTKAMVKPSFTSSNTNASTPRFVHPDVLQQSKTELLLKEAIAKEKKRLVGSIVMQIYKQTATTVSLTQPQPQPPALACRTQTGQLQPTVPVPSATTLVDHIGSQVRVGHGYVDVTQLAGIDKAEAVKPRTNRGGNIETFPEVSAKQPICISIASPTTYHPYSP
jgi:hypothetical protein